METPLPTMIAALALVPARGAAMLWGDRHGRSDSADTGVGGVLRRRGRPPPNIRFPDGGVCMQAIPAVMTPDRPGKTSAWMPLRGAARYDEPESLPFITHPHPRDSGINSLDPVRATFWQACRHLFPPHALAAQTPNGSMVISWSVM